MKLNNRGKLQYSDIIMAFGTLVAIAAVAPWLYQLLDMIQAEVDPLTATILAIFLPLIVIALLVSMGVSARS